MASRTSIAATAASALLVVTLVVGRGSAGAGEVAARESSSPTPPPVVTVPPGPLAPTTTAPGSSAPTAAPKVAAGPLRFFVTLAPGQVTPKPKAVAVGASAQFAAVVTTDTLTWAIGTNKLSGPGAVRIELGAPGKSGNTVITLCGTCAGDGAAAGNIGLTDGQESALRSSRIYVEMSTKKNPTGEVRAQIR